MFCSSTFLTFFYCILLILTVSCNNQLNQIQCDPGHRNANCSLNNSNSYNNNSNNGQQFCGWFDQTVQCFRYPCAITFDSICEACQNQNIAYVTVGDCNSLNSVKCVGQAKQGDVCPFIYEPVCAKFKDGHTETLANSCIACQTQDVVSYQSGQCAIEYSICTPEEHFIGLLCILTVDYVCGVDAKGNQITYDNRCWACKNPATLYVYPGVCQ